MSFDPISIRDEVCKGRGGVAMLIHTPIKYYYNHLSGLAYGCLSNAMMCALAGVNVAGNSLAQQAISAASLSIELKNDSNYTAHWTEASCHYTMSIANWILSNEINTHSLCSATNELDILLAKPRRSLHKSDVEWGLFAYLLTMNYDKYHDFGKKYGLKPFVRSITSDFTFGSALIQNKIIHTDILNTSIAEYITKRTMYFLDTGCHYNAMMLTVLFWFIKNGTEMTVMDAVCHVYDIIGKQYPGEASYNPDPEIVEFAKNR